MLQVSTEHLLCAVHCPGRFGGVPANKTNMPPRGYNSTQSS